MCAGWNSVLITKDPTNKYLCPPSLTVRSLDELYFIFKEALEEWYCLLKYTYSYPTCSVVGDYLDNQEVKET